MIDHMAAVFERLTTQTLRGQIAQRIRSAILNGTLKPGERLVERKLASEFGASLTAVREAVIELETDGFITKRPNAFTYVTKLSIAEIEKVFCLAQGYRDIRDPGSRTSRVTGSYFAVGSQLPANDRLRAAS